MRARALPSLSLLTALVAGRGLTAAQDPAPQAPAASTVDASAARRHLESLPAKDRAALAATLAQLEESLLAQDTAGVLAQFDVEALAERALAELGEGGAFAGAEDRREFETGLSDSLLRPEFAWRGFEIRGSEPGADARELRVHVLHHHSSQAHRTWTLRRHGERFLVADHDSIDTVTPLHRWLALSRARSRDLEPTATLAAAAKDWVVARANPGMGLVRAVEALRALDAPAPFVTLVDRCELDLRQAFGDLDAARELAARLPPEECLSGLFAIADLRVRRGPSAEAFAALDEVDRAFGGTAFAARRRAELHQQSGDSASAQRELRSSLALEPNDAEALHLLAHTIDGEAPGEGDAWQPLREAFLALEEPATQFEHLVTEMQEEGDQDAVLALCDALASFDPQDPNADYYRASVLLERGEAQAAGELLLHALDRAPEHERDAYASAYANALLADLAPLEAYERAAPVDAGAALDAVAAAAIEAQDWDLLQEVTQRRLAADPKDAWPYYYRAHMHWRREELELADQAFEAAMERAVDERADLRDLVRSERASCLASFGEVVRAYKTVLPREQTFVQLVDETMDDVPTLLGLLRAAREDRKDDPLLELLEGYASYRAGDPAEAWKHFADHGDALGPEVPWLGELESAALRSALRSGHDQEALALARRSTERDGDPYYEAVVLGVLGHAAEAEQRAEFCLRCGYDPQRFARDTDLGPRVLEDPAWAAFRARHFD